MSAVDKALGNATGLVQGWTDAAMPTKTLSSHVLALLADTVFARISLLAGWQGAAHMQNKP